MVPCITDDDVGLNDSLYNCKIIIFFTELRSCVKVEVAIVGSPSLIVLMVSGRKATLN